MEPKVALYVMNCVGCYIHRIKYFPWVVCIVTVDTSCIDWHLVNTSRRVVFISFHVTFVAMSSNTEVDVRFKRRILRVMLE